MAKTKSRDSKFLTALTKDVRKDVLDHTLLTSTGTHSADTMPKQSLVSVAELIAQFSRPDISRGRLPLAKYLALDKNDKEQKALRNREKDGEYIILGTFSHSATRSAVDMVELTGFVIDLDGGSFTAEQIRSLMGNTFCIAFTTYSHHPGAPRWRILIPYLTPIHPKEHHKVYFHFDKLFDGQLDKRCNTVAQIWYTAACPPDAGNLFDVFTVPGNLLDVSCIPEPAQKPKAHLPASPNATSLEFERVRSALAVIPSDDRAVWIKIGIALKQNLPEEAGYKLWLEWSRKSDKFDEDDSELTWSSFKEEAPGEAITLGSVYFHAKEWGWTDTCRSMPPELERLNQQHFMAFLGSKNMVFEETYNHELQRPVLQPYSLKDFSEHYSHLRIQVQTEDRSKYVGVVDAWAKHPARRTYKSVVFMPGLPTPLDVYNTWRGFAIQPSPGDWGLFKQHILENVCQGNEAHFDYLIKWMAHAVQRPHERPGVAIVLRGARGTGKGKLATVFMKLFGSHAMQITQVSHLIGKFNYHLRDTVLLFVDEAMWAGDKAGENVLKGLITEEYLQVEKKFADVMTCTNRLHIMMASNSDWVVPAGERERRYFVLQVGDKHVQDHEYFRAIDQQMFDHGGLQAMMHDLLAMDLSRFNIRAFPRTAALDEQMLRSLPAEQMWWMDHLGKADPTKWKYQIRTQLAEEFSVQGGPYFRGRSSQTRLGCFLKKVVPGGVKKVKVPLPGWQGLQDCYEFPDLDLCRQAFVESHGFIGDPWA